MGTSPAGRRTLTVLLVLGALTAALWLVVLLGLVDGPGQGVLRTLAWLLTAVTGGAAIGLRDARRAYEKGRSTPERPARPSRPERRTDAHGQPHEDDTP